MKQSLTFAALVLSLLWATSVHAGPQVIAGVPQLIETSSILSSNVVPDGSRYYRANPTSTAAVAITFPVGALAVRIENEDATNVALIKFIRHGKVVTAAELTAPADNTWSEVQPIPVSTALTFDIRRSVGLIYDKAAGTSAITFRFID